MKGRRFVRVGHTDVNASAVSGRTLSAIPTISLSRARSAASDPGVCANAADAIVAHAIASARVSRRSGRETPQEWFAAE